MCASGGTNSTATQLQDSSVTTPTFTTTRRLVVKEAAKDREPAKLLLMTLSEDREVELVRHIQLPVDRKRNHRRSVVELPDQAHLIHRVRRATSHQLQPADLTIRARRQLAEPAIQVQLKPAAPLVISRQARRNTQALKALTQAPELLFHLPMCHRRRTVRLSKAASRPNQTQPTQPPEHRKRRTEITCRRDVDKATPSRISFSHARKTDQTKLISLDIADTFFPLTIFSNLPPIHLFL